MMIKLNIMKDKRFIFLALAILMTYRLVEGGHGHPKIKSFNVVKHFGAVGDGTTDDSKAFERAWQKVCTDSSDIVRMIVPRKKIFLLNPVAFQGPCTSTNINVKILGGVVAPERSQFKGFPLDNWLQFLDVEGLTVDGLGYGKIDGQGADWWKTCPPGGNKCDKRPTTITFSYCNNLKLAGLKFLNSPANFISLLGCDGVKVSNLHITAPKDSPNTDGINLVGATNVQIHNSVIGVGDDCISMNNHAHDVKITQVTCGPGHGISIGSLGTDSVEKVQVSNCNFKGSSSGVKIKTWQGGDGFVRNVKYEHISIQDVQYPILIDQYYCPNRSCAVVKEKTSIKISDITYNNIFGTSSTTQAITFNCSQLNACENIRLDQIKLTSTLSGQPTESLCINAHGQAGQSVIPEIKCF